MTRLMSVFAGSILLLLLAGPVTSLPAMLALWAMFQKRLVLVFVGHSLLVAILLGWLVQLFR